MDVTKPNVVWIKGRCYRLFGQDVGRNTDSYDAYEKDDQRYVERDLYDDSDNEYEVEETEAGRMKTSFHIPRLLHVVLVGPKGSTRTRIEKETKTLIRIPKKGISADIVIVGPTKESVVQARRRLELIAATSRQKQQFTHFLSLPMNKENIIEGFLRFQEQVLTDCQGRGIGRDIFQDPKKLHITIGTLALLDNTDRKIAADALQKCKHEVIEPLLQSHPLHLSVYGIEYMNDDPAEVDVLYAKIKDLSDGCVVQELADSIVKYFAKTGLMPKQFDAVKLHLTLMNSLFRRDDGDSDEFKGEKQKRIRESFDATSVLKKFEDYHFGDVFIDSVDLSRRYSTASNGYYEATASISLL